MEGIAEAIEQTKRGLRAYRHTRRVRCTVCGVTGRVHVSSQKGCRLRDRLSPCCKARMRPANWVQKVKK